ncbi:MULTISPECIES: hypothetical protein [Sphingobacterium]|uniref:Uncharacterized protein n=1 Tax=Sphingobacterium cellulitidis TaxID=1768011 RepID=A0A8H9KVM5_9SPHI|nr:MULTISPECIES: hypothetical protein [Sphingobacterium]MBA8988447.1 hypothetical protein [Sphingobacterium soli]OYD43313.1 hypothetical protein CHT99_05730 [Sphingobacterium cellulitidis]OYD47350.1 hypothetical protein CHU00_00265 [Sphingobacterium cellulitidis]WFB62709.1 hypothetical protein PZ892_13610 [Sphingobacterium sp. WM]GGE32735.1 hypothetical protein GCM10011516_33060 [Sphingobacterium soli]
MILDEFKSTLKDSQPNSSWDVSIQALWYDAKGEWKKAHDLIDHLNDKVSAHIHAYLHRVEGDLWNARYWYNRAKQPEFIGSLEEEREHLLQLYLN